MSSFISLPFCLSRTKQFSVSSFSLMGPRELFQQNLNWGCPLILVDLYSVCKMVVVYIVSIMINRRYASLLVFDIIFWCLALPTSLSIIIMNYILPDTYCIV